MSVTFYIGKLEIGDGKMKFTMLYPPDFDRTPTVDPEYPEYGEMYPENPWEMNVNNTNARYLLSSLNVDCKPSHTNEFDDSVHGEFLDMQRLIDLCDNILHAVAAMPELDKGTDSTIRKQPGRMTVIVCGRSDDYLNLRIAKLRELAQIALENNAIIYYG